jgi:hypothetical protein
LSQGQNVTVDVLIGSKCYCGRSELGRFVQASLQLAVVESGTRPISSNLGPWGATSEKGKLAGTESHPDCLPPSSTPGNEEAGRQGEVWFSCIPTVCHQPHERRRGGKRGEVGLSGNDGLLDSCKQSLLPPPPQGWATMGARVLVGYDPSLIGGEVFLPQGLEANWMGLAANCEGEQQMTRVNSELTRVTSFWSGLAMN